MERSKEVSSKISAAKCNPYLEGGELNDNNEFLDLWSFILYDILHNVHLSISLMLKNA